MWIIQRKTISNLSHANVSDDLQPSAALPQDAGSLAATNQWTLKALSFLIFSPIKFMFEGSDLGPNFFNHVYACCHYLTSRRIIFRKSNAAREKDLIFRDGSDNAVTFGKCQQNLLRFVFSD
jgi:hypothetical protein